jgi:hypothetical protein
MERPGPAKHKWIQTSACRLPALPCSWSAFNQANLLTIQVSVTDCLGWNLIFQNSWGTDCTPSGQNWWPNTQREFSPSASGRRAKWRVEKPVWQWSNWAAAMGKARHSNVLEKQGASWNWESHEEKRSFLTRRFAFWVERAGDCSFTNHHGTTSENLPAPDVPLH